MWSRRTRTTGERAGAGRVLAVVALLALVATAAAPGIIRIRVHPGDTLWGIAHTHHTTVDRLRRLNHIPAGSDLIYAGALLAVPGTRAAHRSPAGHTSRVRVVHYVVRPGDSVTAIARRHHVSVRSVLVRNHLSAAGLIVPGQRLRIGVRARLHHSAAPGGRHYPAGVTAAAARHRAALSHRAVPSRSRVRSMVAATSRQWGLDPALALAIADMESGFNQRAVSPADAIGTMQVLPSTGRWLSADVVHRHLDLLRARDNVTAGVVLLRLLTRAAPLRQAVAGYYQGLGSVRAHGMFADTRHYVAVVLALRHRFGGR